MSKVEGGESKKKYAGHTMSMRDEYLLDFTHLDPALLYSVLGCLSTIEQPHITTEP
jgi:hypothetical protein